MREFSETSDVSNGGQLGLRPASRYPELFVQATRQLGVGDVAALVRSPAGFHVLKVVEKVTPEPSYKARRATSCCCPVPA